MEAHDQERRDIDSTEGGGVGLLGDLNDQVFAIASREDFIAFVSALRRDLLRDPDGWENPTLDRYLDALAAWGEDLDGFFANRGEPTPTEPSWRLFGMMLLAAKYYE